MKNKPVKNAVVQSQYRGGLDSAAVKITCPYCKQSQTIKAGFETKDYICTNCGNPIRVILEV